MPAIAHGRQLPNFPVGFLGLRRQQPSVYPRPTVRREHECDLVEGEPGAAPKRDQREPLEHAGIEDPAKAAPSDRGYQPLLLVEPQRRSGDPGAPRDLCNIHL